jgi:outer membrane protein TolC
MRSGGTITVDLPTNRTDTNNSFSTLNPSYSTDARFSISQPLLRNAGRRTNTHSIRIQSLETQIAEAQAKLEVIRELAQVDRAYWLLYAGQRQLEVAQEQYELAIEQLERAERRVRAQVAPEVEIIRAQDGVASRLEDIIIAENRVRQRQRNLKRLVNVDGIDMGSTLKFVLTTQPDPVRYEFDGEGLADSAIANRMEMLELELRLAQDFSTIDFQRNQMLPNFVMDFQYSPQGLGDSTGDSLDLLSRGTFQTWQIGANLDISIGNEAAEARVHQAILRRLQRLASKAARDQSIRQEVFDAIDELNASWQRILAARQATILAARTVRAEQNQFDVGARTSTDVLDAATRLADAQSSEIVALATYEIALVDLAFSTGTLLGQAKVDWQPRDPRGPDDFVGESAGRVPLGPPGVQLPETE